jgi:hypothetical protein
MWSAHARQLTTTLTTERVNMGGHYCVRGLNTVQDCSVWPLADRIHRPFTSATQIQIRSEEAKNFFPSKHPTAGVFGQFG